MPIELGALTQAHDSRCALTGAQRAGEQSVFSSNSNGSDLVLCPVVVDWQLTIIQKARECTATLDAVIERFGRGRTVSYLDALLGSVEVVRK